MTESVKPTPAADDEESAKFPFSLKRIAEFVANVLRLERNVASLTSKLDRLQEHNSRMQRQLDEQTGQLKQLSQFLHETLNERIDSRAERATLQLIDTILSVRSDAEREAIVPPPKKPRNKK